MSYLAALSQTMDDCKEGNPRDLIGCMLVNYVINFLSYLEIVSIYSLVDTISGLHLIFRYLINIILYSINIYLFNILLFAIKDLIVNSYHIFIKMFSNTWTFIKICFISYVNYKIFMIIYCIRNYSDTQSPK